MIHFKQFQIAMNGSERMLIWLGKQRLGQVEKVESRAEFDSKVVIYLSDNGREKDPDE
jgi:hypothetical protein